MTTSPAGLPESTDPDSWARWVVTFRRNADGIITQVDDGIVHWTGYSREEIQASPEAMELVCVAEDEESDEGRALKEGLPRQFVVRHRKTRLMRRILEWSWDTGGKIKGETSGVWVDISLMERMRGRLWEGLWKETVTGLTTGFLHDLNNILAGIGSLSELSLMDLSPEHPLHGNLKMLKENTYKATGLTEQLTRFLHAKKGKANYHNLNQVVTEVCAASKLAIPRSIECILELADGSLPVCVDGRDLQQVIFSLIFNGVGSIDGKGRLVLGTATHETMPEGAMVWGKRIEGPCFSLRVEDSGEGLGLEFLEELASMDYSTKPANAEVGLGLAHAAAFCGEVGGALTALSEVDRGGDSGFMVACR